jgi:hypothetical protein
MKNNYRIIKQGFVVLFVMLFAACDDYLEYNEMKADAEDLIWSEFTNIRKAVFGIYNYLPSTFEHVGGSFLDCATDNAETSNANSNIQRFNSGAWNMFDNPDNVWSKNYRGIYNANKFIESADTASLSNYKWNQEQYAANMADLEAYKGEARFMRAYFYFELLKRYGGVPIVETTSSIDFENSQQLERKRYQEVTDYISAQCDSAMKYLPKKKELGSEALGGRIYYGAALALKCRNFLYAASPLNNENGATNAYYDSCALAASQFLGLGYNITGVDYQQLFVPDDVLHSQNTEVILDVRNSATLSYEKNNYPVGSRLGKGFTNPSQNLIDAYEMKDGSPFDWNNPVHAAQPFENRDKRLTATVLCNGASFGSRVIETFKEGVDAGGQRDYYGTKTGYYLKKYLSTGLDLETSPGTKHVWFLFRYAEVLLNYAEAMNEKYGPDQDPNGYGKTALQALNEVRARAGQPAFSTSSKEECRDKIRNERRVEFAFEDHRFWDVRRWKIGPQTLGATIHGVDIEKIVDEVSGETSFTYSVMEVEERVFEEKMYRYPIPANEVLNSNGLEQNPGW